MKKEEQLLTESSRSDTHNEESNPRVIEVTEGWVGKSIAIVGAPPPAK